MKGVHELSGLKNIKSIHSVGARSIPKVQRSSFLELYVLKREKDRLEKEIFVLGKRKDAADRQLNSVSKRIKGLQKETKEGKKRKGFQEKPARLMKSIPISY
jgi:hypothetical protein